MIEGESTKYEIRKRAAWISLNRPKSRNALSAELLAELSTHIQAAMEDPGVRVIVLTGSGPAFCAGADLKSGGAGITEGNGIGPKVGVGPCSLQSFVATEGGSFDQFRVHPRQMIVLHEILCY